MPGNCHLLLAYKAKKGMEWNERGTQRKREKERRKRKDNERVLLLEKASGNRMQPFVVERDKHINSSPSFFSHPLIINPRSLAEPIEKPEL